MGTSRLRQLIRLSGQRGLYPRNKRSQGGTLHLIIDADPIVYRCGFSSETPTYQVVYDDGEGHISEIHFSPKPGLGAAKLRDNWLNTNPPEYEILDSVKVSIPGTEEEAIAAVRTQLFSIEKSCKEYYRISEFSKISTILSGPGNFRDSIATVFPYKGNRDSSHKPYWYQSIRNYLSGEWGARIVHGREADDECSILARRDRDANTDYCIATIDKDLDQIPGKHYNYLKLVHHRQSVDDASRWFWQQCLSGDATDGVPGCYKLGPVGAERLIHAASSKRRSSAAVLSPVDADAAGAASYDDTRRIWSAIVAAYAQSQSKAGCPYVGRDPEAIALETARLVYLQQIEGELWAPPGEPKKWLPGYTPENDDE